MKKLVPRRIPLYRQTEARLRYEVIAQLQPGQRLDSEIALAKRFGVSLVTIREALSALAQAGLVERRHGSGTYVAQLAKKLVAVYSEMDIFCPGTSHFFHRVIQQSRRFFEQRGYRTRLYVGHNPPGEKQDEPTCTEFVQDAVNNKISGVLALATVPHSKWMEPLLKNHVPIVGDENYLYSILVDYPEMVRQSVRHLLDQGRRKIALMGWRGDYPQADQLRASFEEIARDLCLPMRKHWICLDLHPNLAGAGWEEFREIWTASDEKPDGLIVCDDILFREAMIAILELGVRVPEKLLVVTQTTKSSGIRSPFPVARMEVDPDAFVQTAGEVLVRLINHEHIKENKVYLPFQFIAPDCPVQSSPGVVSRI